MPHLPRGHSRTVRHAAAGTFAVAATLAVSACGGSGSGGAGASTSHAGGSSAPTTTKSTTAFTLKDSGFGQNDEYVWVTSIVHNDSGVVGQTVTVHFDLKTADGTVVKSDDQVESFSRVGQDLVVGTQVEVPKRTKITEVKATPDVEDDDTFSDTPSPDLPITGQKTGKGEYGGWSTHYVIANPTSKPIKDARIGIVCYNSAGKINGGGVEFPDLIPAGGQSALDSDVLVSGKPASCKSSFGGTLDVG